MNFHDAAKKGDLALVKACLANHDPEERNLYNHTPLHLAAAHGHADVVKELLKAHADVEAVCNNELRPLHFAAQNGHAEIVRILLEAGAQKDACDQWNKTPLMYAAFNGKVEALDVLIEAKATVEVVDERHYSPLRYAVVYGNKGVISSLLAAGADIESRDLFNRTILHSAANNARHTGRLKLLLIARANIEARDKAGWTPLHYAASNCFIGGLFLEKVKMLVQAGAHKDVISCDGKTPCDVARLTAIRDYLS